LTAEGAWPTILTRLPDCATRKLTGQRLDENRPDADERRDVFGMRCFGMRGA
jgi:hypothetical protein